MKTVIYPKVSIRSRPCIISNPIYPNRRLAIENTTFRAKESGGRGRQKT